jgi:hypothetical protein
MRQYGNRKQSVAVSDFLGLPCCTSWLRCPNQRPIHCPMAPGTRRERLPLAEGNLFRTVTVATIYPRLRTT